MSKFKYIIKKPIVWLVFGMLLGTTGMILSHNPIGLSNAHATEVLKNNTTIKTILEADAEETAIVSKVVASVVHINTDTLDDKTKEENAAKGLYSRPSGTGSGVIIGADGWIITNDHVVEGCKQVKVTLNDGRELIGNVTHSNDVQIDLALVKIDAKNLNLQPIVFGDSSKVALGQRVIIGGSPTGLRNSVTFGHVAALSRESLAGSPTDPNNIRAYFDLLQLDAIILPGNSGGVCANMRGELIGINSAKIPNGDGIGFAIKGNFAKRVADTLIKQGKIKRSFIGALPIDLKEYQKKDLKVPNGAILEVVEKNGPAAKAGLKAKDIIIKIDRDVIRSQQDVRNQAIFNPPGTKLVFTYLRDGVSKTATVITEAPKVAPKRRPHQRNFGGYQGFPPFFRDFFGPGFGGGEFFGGPSQGYRQFQDDENDEDENESQENVPQEKPKGITVQGPFTLGATVADLSLQYRKKHFIPNEITGVFVEDTKPNSAARTAGIKKGDVIMQLGNNKIKSISNLKAALAAIKKGTSVAITYGRFGKGTQMQSTVMIDFGNPSANPSASSPKKRI